MQAPGLPLSEERESAAIEETLGTQPICFMCLQTQKRGARGVVANVLKVSEFELH